MNEFKNSDATAKQSAVWTTDATLNLLKVYQDKLDMLETPKKKTKIWQAISEKLKEHNLEVTPDQVRWKINALAKKYKQCVDNGETKNFKYFNEMDNIYTQYNVECTEYSINNADKLEKKRYSRRKYFLNSICSNNIESYAESKTMIRLRKIRLANRIQADRSQSKINLEMQWLDYLKRQEKYRLWRDEILEKRLKLKEAELELKTKELTMKETLEIRKLTIKETDQEELLLMEKEKLDYLKRIFSQ